MSTLEDRLRRDLPPLADAMIAARDDVDPRPAAADADARTTTTAVRRDRSRTIGRAVLGAAAAALVVAGLVALQRDDQTTVDTAEDPVPAGFGTWSSIPDAPIAPRAYPVTGWTGSEALFWAGSSVDRGFAHTDAALYDPDGATWRTISAPGWGHPGLTGAVFDGSVYAVAKGSGSRFDLGTQEWIPLPEVEGMYFSGIVASDDAIWALGPATTNPDGQPDLAIVRYDPDTDEWVPGPVFEGTDETAAALASLQSLEQPAVWTGTDVVVWGDRTGIAFDPEQSDWRALPALRPPAGAVVATRAVANGDGLSVVAQLRDGEETHLGVAHLDATTSAWTWTAQDLPSTDLSTATVVPAGPWTVLLPADGPPITVHTRRGAWQQHDSAPLQGIRGPGTVWTGSQLIVWGGQPEDAGDGDQPTGMTWTAPSSTTADTAVPTAADQETSQVTLSAPEMGVALTLPDGWKRDDSSDVIVLRGPGGRELQADWNVATDGADEGSVLLPAGPTRVEAVEGGYRASITVDCAVAPCRTLDMFAYGFPAEPDGPTAVVALLAGLEVTGPTLTGTLPDGRSWSVRQDFRRGICVTIDRTPLGCDPPIGAPDVPVRPRVAALDVGAWAEEDAGNLVFGILPEPPFRPTTARLVTLDYPDGRPADGDAVVADARTGLWAAPVTPGDLPRSVTFFDESGDVIATMPL